MAITQNPTPYPPGSEEEWWAEDADRLNNLCDIALRMGLIPNADQPIASPPLAEDGTLKSPTGNEGGEDGAGEWREL